MDILLFSLACIAFIIFILLLYIVTFSILEKLPWYNELMFFETHVHYKAHLHYIYSNVLFVTFHILTYLYRNKNNNDVVNAYRNHCLVKYFPEIS
jgi:hypothetical protein